jgi:predicted aspartyl protease
MIRAAVLFVAAFLLLGRPAASEAEIYRWIDERGVPNYTEGIDSVPPKHRSTAVPMGLRNAPPAPAAAPSAPGADPATPGAAGATGAVGAGSAQVKFTPGEEIVVDARLNGGTAAKLLLDTGAQRSVINPRVLAAAGVSLQQSEATELKGATGTANVSTVQLDSVEVGQAKVGKLAVISHDIEQRGVDGLLGRDFLDQFKVSIDNKAGVVTLSPK